MRLDWVRGAFDYVYHEFAQHLRGVRGAFGLGFEVGLRRVYHVFTQIAKRTCVRKLWPSIAI